MSRTKRTEWEQKMRHEHKGYRGPGIRIYYMMQGATPFVCSTVCSTIALKTRGNRVELLGGGWLHTKNAYFTAGQCHRGEGKWMNDALKKAAHTLGQARAALAEADARLTGMVNTLEDE